MPVVNIRLSDEVRRQLKIMAAVLDITQGDVIERALAALQREVDATKGQGEVRP